MAYYRYVEMDNMQSEDAEVLENIHLLLNEKWDYEEIEETKKMFGVSFGALFDAVFVKLNEYDFCLISRVCHPCLGVKASRKAAKGLDSQAWMA